MMFTSLYCILNCTKCIPYITMHNHYNAIFSGIKRELHKSDTNLMFSDSLISLPVLYYSNLLL